MIIDWATFLPALVLLLTPVRLFHGKKTGFREVSRDWDQHWLLILKHEMHVIDLGRAALGTWLLIESLHAVPGAHGSARYAPVLTQGAIRIFAVLLQTVICRHPESLNAPFAFVTGLVLGAVSPLVGGFALAVAVPLTMGTRSTTAYFPLLGLAQLGFGFWFKGKGAVLGLSFGTVATFVPLLWPMMFQRPLVIAYRAKRHAADYVPDRLR